MATFWEEVSKIFTDLFIDFMVGAGKDISSGDLRRESREYNVSDWITYNGVITGGSGLGTGILGGPWAYAGETADIAILLRSISRGCFGIGYIMHDKVDYDEDMIAIMALWAGYAQIQEINESVIAIPTGKIAIKLLFSSKPEVAKVAAKLSVYSISALLKKGATKSAYKVTPKFITKIAQKGAVKVAPKAAGKVGTKWIPFVGGAVSAGINLWVYNQITSEARRYYNSMKKGGILVVDKSDFES